MHLGKCSGRVRRGAGGQYSREPTGLPRKRGVAVRCPPFWNAYRSGLRRARYTPLGPDTPHWEMFSGFEASNNYASGYVGGGYAFGNLYAPGWRVRAVGAYGRYHYDGALFDGSDYVGTTFDGQVGFASAQVGYQFRPGAVIVKLVAGIEAEAYRAARSEQFRSRYRGRPTACRRDLVRHLLPLVPLGRRVLRHRLPGILQPCARGLSRPPETFFRCRGRCAR